MNTQEIATNLGLTITTLAVIRVVFRVHFDKEVIRALKREAPAWRDAGREHFPELYSGLDTANKATSALEKQSEELRRLNVFVEETIKPLSGLPTEIRLLKQSIDGLSDVASNLQPLSTTVAVLMDRVGLKESDIPKPTRGKNFKREQNDQEETQ